MYEDYKKDSDELWNAARNEASQGRKFILWGIPSILLLMAVFSVIAFAAGWIGGTSKIVSFENFEEQHFQLQQDYESMRKSAGDVCAAQQVLDSAIERGAEEEVVSQRESQLLARGEVYRSLQADYDRRMNNFFETMDGFVAPQDLPQQSPSLDSMKAEVC